MEDAAWLKKKGGESAHINVAELNAVAKGVNLAVKWGARQLKIVTDSATGIFVALFGPEEG